MKNLLVLLILFMGAAGFAQGQSDTLLHKSYIDTALLGIWKIEDPIMIKVVSTSRDYFIRPIIQFKDRQLYEVDKERHEWNWNFSEENKELEIADMEELLVQSYVIKELDANKLVLMMGKQEIIFHKVQ
ncbi:MAG: hypothetical protein ACYC1Q_07925 [Bacteroidia bacterium]